MNSEGRKGAKDSICLRAIVLSWCVLAGNVFGKPGLYRVSWGEHPATSATVGWSLLSGEKPVLRYGRLGTGEFKTQAPQVIFAEELTNCFVRLEELKPDAAYWFEASDSEGAGRRLWFRTAPAGPKPFAFVAGGDARLDYGQNERYRKVRVAGNRLLSKLRPLFVLYGGDYVFDGLPERWRKWLEDWQETISADGRIYPIVPVFGNHEAYDAQILHKMFFAPTNRFFSVGIGDDLFRLWVLDSEARAGAVERQRKWFSEELAKYAGARRKMAAYHSPMRPHSVSKSNRNWLYDRWANLFFENGMDVIFESDQHSVKRTWPICPDKGAGSYEGFVRDDERGTVYVGEGTWGAPMRAANNPKPWTRACGRFNQFKWVWVSWERAEIRSVKFERADAAESVSDEDPFREPKGIVFWTPPSGKVLRVPLDPNAPSVKNAPEFVVWLDRNPSAWSWEEDSNGVRRAECFFDVPDASLTRGKVFAEFSISPGDVVVRLNGNEILRRTPKKEDLSDVDGKGKASAGPPKVDRFVMGLDAKLLRDGKNRIEAEWSPVGDGKPRFDVRMGAWTNRKAQ